MAVYIVGVAGASGAPYTQRVLHGLLAAGHDVKAVVSDAGRKVIEVEERLRLKGEPDFDRSALLGWAGGASLPGTLELYDPKNVAAPIASGSFDCAGMVVVPCSGGTLARIAHGVSAGLIERAADVCLKERRKLILVPRETPLGLIHLRNMVAVTEAGAIVMPAMPGFYHNPQSVQDLVDMVAGRVLAHLGVPSDMLKAWQGPDPAELYEVERD